MLCLWDHRRLRAQLGLRLPLCRRHAQTLPATSPVTRKSNSGRTRHATIVASVAGNDTKQETARGTARCTASDDRTTPEARSARWKLMLEVRPWASATRTARALAHQPVRTQPSRSRSGMWTCRRRPWVSASAAMPATKLQLRTCHKCLQKLLRQSAMWDREMAHHAERYISTDGWCRLMDTLSLAPCGSCTVGARSRHHHALHHHGVHALHACGGRSPRRCRLCR